MIDYLSKVLKLEPNIISDLERKMEGITNKKGIIERIVKENEMLVEEVLSIFGLAREKVSFNEVYNILENQVVELEERLKSKINFSFRDKNRFWIEVLELALELSDIKSGFFIKEKKAKEMLKNFPPYNLLSFFGYKDTEELIEKEDFDSVFSSLRFAQDSKWMSQFFNQAYNNLTPQDFEERPIRIKILEEKWVDLSQKFLVKKYHNISHLKELGIIFVIPEKEPPKSGEILRNFLLFLHYLNEVPFYSRLFKKISKKEKFIEGLKSLLRGDVIDDLSILDKSKTIWLIVQRYLAKDNPDDKRLFIPHINPEAEHWFNAQLNMAKLGNGFNYWQNLDFVFGYFKNNGQEEKLITFNIVDLAMNSATNGNVKYVYHQKESLWNKIFIEYFGREKMNELIEENILKGYIEF